MSDYATFVSQQFACNQCFNEALKVMVKHPGIHVRSFGTTNPRKPIICGYLDMCEFPAFDLDWMGLEQRLCHSITFAILDEEGRPHAVRFDANVQGAEGDMAVVTELRSPT